MFRLLDICHLSIPNTEKNMPSFFCFLDCIRIPGNTLWEADLGGLKIVDSPSVDAPTLTTPLPGDALTLLLSTTIRLVEQD
jgi:hypothetical protein